MCPQIVRFITTFAMLRFTLILKELKSWSTFLPKIKEEKDEFKRKKCSQLAE